jgi:hypothetical protein
MPGFGVVLDPAAVAPGRAELNLNSGAIQVVGGEGHGIDWGEAAVKAFLAEQQYGESATDFRVANRIISIPLLLGAKDGGTQTEQEAARRALEQKVALFQRQGGVLMRQRASGELLYADIVTATLIVPDVWEGNVEPGVVLKLECLPDFYGAEVELDTIEEAGQINSVLQKGGLQATILGDYPARTRIVLTEKSKHDQRSLLWGFSSTFYASGAETALALDAYLLTLVNGATSAVESGTYSGKWAILSAPEPNVWHPFIETTIAASGKNLNHVGSYRVWARCSGIPPQQVRLAWSANNALAPTYNAAVPIGTVTAGGFNLLDLGEVRVEESPIGEHWWKGILQVNTGASSVPLAVDRIWLQPLDDGAGRSRATGVPISTLLAPVHSATTAANATGGIAGTVAWKNTAGSTTTAEHASVELNNNSSQVLKLTGLGFAIPSGAEIKGIEVLSNTYVAAGQPGHIAVLKAILFKAGAQAGVADSESGSGDYVFLPFGSSNSLWGTTWTPAQINASNFGVGFVAESGPAEIIVQTASPVTVRVYYSIGASTITQDAVLFSERKTEIRTEGSYREDTASTTYARVSEETGALPRLPPSGFEKRPALLFVKNSRALLTTPGASESGEQDTGIDKIQAQVFYRPCYIGRI